MPDDTLPAEPGVDTTSVPAELVREVGVIPDEPVAEPEPAAETEVAETVESEAVAENGNLTNVPAVRVIDPATGVF